MMCAVCVSSDTTTCLKCGEYTVDSQRYIYSTTTKKFHPICDRCSRKS
jgi:hypothetical protein